MQCAYLVHGGNRLRRCQRKVQPGETLCRFHQRLTASPADVKPDSVVESDPWKARVRLEALKLLRETKSQNGLVDEISMLRLMIRESVAVGNYHEARRAISTLAGAIKLTQQPNPAKDFQARLDRVIASMDPTDSSQYYFPPDWSPMVP